MQFFQNFHISGYAFFVILHISIGKFKWKMIGGQGGRWPSYGMINTCKHPSGGK